MFLADKSANNEETMLRVYKAWFRVPFVGKCIGCYLQVENHEDWCKDPDTNFNSKDKPIVSRKELENVIEDSVAQQQHSQALEATQEDHKDRDDLVF